MSGTTKQTEEKNQYQGTVPFWTVLLAVVVCGAAVFVAVRQTYALRELRQAVAVAVGTIDGASGQQLRAQIGTSVCRRSWAAAWRRGLDGVDGCDGAEADDDLRSYCASAWIRWTDGGLLCGRF